MLVVFIYLLIKYIPTLLMVILHTPEHTWNTNLTRIRLKNANRSFAIFPSTQPVPSHPPLQFTGLERNLLESRSFASLFSVLSPVPATAAPALYAVHICSVNICHWVTNKAKAEFALPAFCVAEVLLHLCRAGGEKPWFLGSKCLSNTICAE